MVLFDSGNQKYFCICNLNCWTLGLSSTVQEIFQSVVSKSILYESHKKYHTRLSRTIHQPFSIWQPPQNVGLTWTVEKKRLIFPRCTCSLSWTCSFLVLLTWTHCFHIWTLRIFHSMHDMLIFLWIHWNVSIKCLEHLFMSPKMLSKLEAVMLRQPQEVQVWHAVSFFFLTSLKIQVCNANV